MTDQADPPERNVNRSDRLTFSLWEVRGLDTPEQTRHTLRNRDFNPSERRQGAASHCDISPRLWAFEIERKTIKYHGKPVFWKFVSRTAESIILVHDLR